MAALLPDLPQTEAAVIQMTNAFRGDHRLASVQQNPALKAAAQAFADYLAQQDKFAHTADGRQPAERARAAGYRYCMVAENLALNQSSRGFEAVDLAEQMVEGWKQSAPHRAAMLNPHVTEIGVGISQAATKDPKFLTVQLFGRPESFKYEVHIENRTGATVSYGFGDNRTSVPDSTRMTHRACVPAELTFDAGKVTSKFEATDGAVYIISRGLDGSTYVERQKPSIAAPTAALKKASAPASPAKAPKATPLAQKAPSGPL